MFRGLNAVMMTAMVLLIADCGVVLAMTEHPVVAAATSTARIAALCALWVQLARRAGTDVTLAGQWWPVSAYAYALFAVFGSSAVACVRNWIWLPTCDAGLAQSPLVEHMVLLDRAFLAALGAVILWACCRTTTPQTKPRPTRTPGLPSVATLAMFSFPLCFLAAVVYQHLVGAHAWCHQLTSDALPPSIQFWTFVASGFEEELTFTGTGLALLAGARRPQLIAALAVNIAARMALHLYYPDHHTVLLWLGWIVMWSGGGLLIAMAVGRYALAQGMSRPRFAVAWSVSAACAHSLTNMLDLGGALLLLLGSVSVMAVCAMEMSARGPRSRTMLWWLATSDSTSEQADRERETIA